jgi:hypothetical protein
MGSRSKQKQVHRTRIPGETTFARETVERTWHSKIVYDDSLARLVTAVGSRSEPHHRWLVFKQAFSPDLVRLFLKTAEPDPPVLDPFAGIGTTVIECARRNVPALGVDPLFSAAYVSAQIATGDVPDLPDLTGCENWPEVADRLELPIHRAALICAVASRQTSKGRTNKNAPPICEALNQVIAIMRDDALHPPPRTNLTIRGDARSLDCIADESVGGILTSPPYLSRHDYTKITRAHEDVYHHWYHRRPTTDDQVSAHPRSKRRTAQRPLPAAVDEACQTLHDIDEHKLARVTGDYFEDLTDCMSEWQRVLRPGAFCWMVIGGARIRDVYIPSDTILAGIASDSGFAVEEIAVARRVVPSGRNFGTLQHVAPRESVLVLRKR